MSQRPATQIKSVTRACRLMVFVSGQADGCTATEAAAAHRLTLPTTYHLLNTLVAEGFLAKDSRRRYTVGPKVGALSDAFLGQVSAPEYLLLPLRQLAETTGESAYLTAWRGHEIRVLASVEGAHPVRVAGPLTGYYANAHARASGKLLLAYARPEVREGYLQANLAKPLTPRTIIGPADLEREFAAIQERGYAYDEQEFAEGVCCVAAPVIESGVAIAALGLSVPLDRFNERRQSLTEATLITARNATSTAQRVSIEQPRGHGEVAAVAGDAGRTS